jgi:hypothetical protein
VKKVRNAVIADRVMVSEELEKIPSNDIVDASPRYIRLILVTIYFLIDIQILFN